MVSPEDLPGEEQDPRLGQILDQYGEVAVIDHTGHSLPLSQAVNECPPFVAALLNAEGPEQLEQIINTLKAPQ